MKKKLYNKQSVAVMVLMIISLQGMEVNEDVYFGSGKHVAIVPKYNLEKMRGWDSHYQKNKKLVDNGLIIPLFRGVSLEALELVNNALSHDIDKFGVFYSKLSAKNKRLLIKVSGQYGKSKEQLMLNIPLLTVQLMENYFPKDICKQIEKHCYTILEEEVINHLTVQLFENSRKKNDTRDAADFLFHDIDYGSLWMPCEHVMSQSNKEIPLFINDKQHEVYASYFPTDMHEYRIADKKDNRCSLWIIDHENVDNKNFTFSVAIEHKAAIQGSCYEKTTVGDEYVVTYSSKDIVISRIENNNDVFFVTQIHHAMENYDKIVDACINGDAGHLIVGVYQGYKSKIDILSLQEDKIVKEGDLFSFEDCGMLKKIFISRNSESSYGLRVNCLFISGGQPWIYFSDYVNNGYTSLTLHSPYKCCVNTPSRHTDLSSSYYAMYKDRDDFIVFNKNFSLMDYDIELAKKRSQKKNEDSFFTSKWNEVKAYIAPTVDYHRYYKYSPNGKFLLYCTFTDKYGLSFIKTILMNARTREFLASDERAYSSVHAIGFAPDGNSLIFSATGLFQLQLNDTLSCRELANSHTQEIEKKMSSSMLSAFLLRDLCLRWKKDKCLHLNSNDPVYAWLKKLISSCQDKDVSNFLMNYFPEVK